VKHVTETDQPISGVNITPVIDVSLVLLLIILVTSPVLNIPSIPVNLPEAVTTEAKEQNVTVSLSKDGRMSIDSTMVNEQMLIPQVMKALGRRKDVLVIVRADREVPYGKIETILEELTQKVGAHNVAVATQQKTKPAQGFQR